MYKTQQRIKKSTQQDKSTILKGTNHWNIWRRLRYNETLKRAFVISLLYDLLEHFDAHLLANRRQKWECGLNWWFWTLFSTRINLFIRFRGKLRMAGKAYKKIGIIEAGEARYVNYGGQPSRRKFNTMKIRRQVLLITEPMCIFHFKSFEKKLSQVQATM